MKIDIRNIITEEVLGIQESFAYATGFGVVFTDPEGNHIGEGSNFQKICRAINETDLGKSCCVTSNQHAIRLALESGQPSIYVCHAGMVNIEIPIIIEGQFIGAVTAGQVFSENMDSYPSDTILQPFPWKKEKPFADYYASVPTLREQQVWGTAKALDSLAKYIVGVYVNQQMSKELLEKNERLHNIELTERILLEQLMEARFMALQKQITPHFIFNVLNAVSRLIEMQQYDIAQSMLSRFSRMFRFHFSEENSLISLSREMEYIEDYLYINQIRFGDRVQYQIRIPARLRGIQIPLFSLQPFVENALTHGLLTKESGGRLLIKGKTENKRAILTISDNGIGICAKKLSEIHFMLSELKAGREIYSDRYFGIFNSAQRLQLYFNHNVDIQMESLPEKGVKVVIAVPLSASDSDTELTIPELQERSEKAGCADVSEG